MRKTLNQSGMVDMVLILVVFLAALALGGYVYYQQKQAQKADTAASSGVIVATHNDNALITSRVQSFYDSYAGKDLGGKDPKLTLDQLQAKGLITAAEVSKLGSITAADPVLCTQGGSDQPIKVGAPTVSGTTAKVAVTQNYTGTGTPVPLTIQVQLTKTKDWEISGITCPQ